MARTETQIKADIDQLRQARASGVDRVTINGESVTFRSVEAMRKTERDLFSELAEAQGRKRRRSYVAYGRKGV